MEYYGNLHTPLTSYQGFMDSMPGSSHPAGSRMADYDRLHGSRGDLYASRGRRRDGVESMMHYEAPMGMQSHEMDIINSMTSGVLPDEYEDDAFYASSSRFDELVGGGGRGYAPDYDPYEAAGGPSRYEEDILGPRPRDRYASLGGMMASSQADGPGYASASFGNSRCEEAMDFGDLAGPSYGEREWDAAGFGGHEIARPQTPRFASLAGSSYGPAMRDEYQDRVPFDFGSQDRYEEERRGTSQRGYQPAFGGGFDGYPRYEGRMDDVRDSYAPFRSRAQDYEDLFGCGGVSWN